MEKIYVYQLSDKELNAELQLCLGLSGCHKNRLEEMEISEYDKMIRAIKKYQGKMHIEDFRKAFDDYSFGELECDKFKPTAPSGIGFLLKAYKDKKYGSTPKKEYNANVNTLPPSTDEGYYNSLICVMEGRVSERLKLFNPDAKPGRPNIIPMTWAWDAVYNHLRKLKEIDNADTFEDQKKAVKLWLYTKYPNAKEQSDMFGKAPITQGSGMGSRLKQMLGV